MTGRVASAPAPPWAIGVIAGMASYLDAAALTTVALSLSVWQHHFDLSAWQTGFLSFGLSVSFAIGSLIGGWLGDRFGRVRLLGVDVAVFVVGCLVLITSASGTQLVVGAVAVGLAAGADLPVSLAVISDLVPAAGRGRLVGLSQVLWIAGILATFLLGFLVSGLGHLGTQLLVTHLVVLGVATWLLRLRLPRPEPPASAPAHHVRVHLRPLVAVDTLPTWLALTAFILTWNLASTTLGSFGPYYLVRVTGLTQTEATGLVLLTFPVSLLAAVGFVRLADTPWRNRLFVVGAAPQIAGFTTGALTAGVAIWGMVTLIVLYSLSNSFAGEAAFKVWSQLLLPAGLRGTATGISIAVARAAAALVLIAVPTIIAARPAALIWALAGFVTVSGVIGLIIVSRVRQRETGVGPR